MEKETDPQDVTARATAAYLHKLGIPFLLSNVHRSIGDSDRLYSLEEIEYEFDQDPRLDVSLRIGRQSGLMQINAAHFDGEEGKRDFEVLMDGVSVDTPTYSSWFLRGRLFWLDERLASLGEPWFAYKSLWVDVEDYNSRVTLPPGLSSERLELEWIRSLEDCQGRFQRLPDFVIDRIIAANEYDEEDELFPEELSSAVDW